MTQYGIQEHSSARFVALAAGLMLVGAAAPALAAGEERAHSSLQWAPADAAFYTGMFRNREQIEAVIHSRAWAKLCSLPVMQTAWRQLEDKIRQPDSELAPVLQLYEMPENRDLLRLLGDMGGQEIFCFGGANWVDFADVAGQLMMTMQFNPAFLGARGSAEDARKHQARVILDLLAQHIDALEVPDLVVGFRIVDTERAERQLGRLEQFLKMAEAQAPQFKGRVQRGKSHGGDFITVTVDGSMIPWDKLPIEDWERSPGEFDDLIKKLKAFRITASMGIRDRYVLIVLGRSMEILSRLGGKSRLLDRPEFKPLANFLDRRLTAVSYVSQAMHAKVTTTPKDIDVMARKGADFLAQSGLPEQMQDRLAKDLKELAHDLKQFFPEVGATLDFGFLNDNGQESYSYDWGEHPTIDGSQSLTILDHVGGKPLMVSAGRTRRSPERYQVVVKWAKIATGYAEDVVLPLVGEEQRDRYEAVAKVIKPLLRRLDETTSQKLLPALADGQFAFVVDAKLKSRQWYRGLPPTREPLAVLEPACIWGVSDAAKLRGAFADYRSILNDAILSARELGARTLPPFQIPEPEDRPVASGVLYYYPNQLLQLFGVDPQFQPAAGLSDNAFVLTISRAHAERLLKKTPLEIDRSLLGVPGRALAEAVYVDWPGIVDALAPWVDIAATAAAESPMAADGNRKSDHDIQGILLQVHDGFDLLKVLRSHGSISYIEGSVLVTHSRTVFADR
jgi:hypothetical protein